jgi:hypothetical protein
VAAPLSYAKLGSLVRSPIGGKQGLLPRSEAYSQIRQCIAETSSNRFSRGSVYDISASAAPAVLVGDLHARTDNLERILNHGSNLDKIVAGERHMILLGDAQHNEVDLYEMDTSVQIMQHIMELMSAAAPNGNFSYILGNHDYFSGLFYRFDAAGNRVFQGALMRERMNELNGDEYPGLYKRLMKNCHLLAIGGNFVGTHAGPIASHFTMDELENLDVMDERNNLVYQLQWNRFSHDDYDQSTVERFMARLGKSGSVLLVGHTHPKNGSWHKELFPGHRIIFAGHNLFGYALASQSGLDLVDVDWV